MDFNTGILLSSIALEAYYAILVIACSAYIFFRTNKLYQLSNYKGLRFFRDSFFFWGIAFLTRLVYMVLSELGHEYMLIWLLFNYLLSMAGLYLVYSLVWKQLGDREIVLHAFGAGIAFSEAFLLTNAVYIAQILILSYAIVIALSNYKSTGKFSQLYLISLILALIGFAANFASLFFIDLYPLIRLYVYAVTVAIFLIATFSVAKAMRV